MVQVTSLIQVAKSGVVVLRGQRDPVRDLTYAGVPACATLHLGYTVVSILLSDGVCWRCCDVPIGAVHAARRQDVKCTCHVQRVRTTVVPCSSAKQTPIGTAPGQFNTFRSFGAFLVGMYVAVALRWRDWLTVLGGVCFVIDTQKKKKKKLVGCRNREVKRKGRTVHTYSSKFC